MLPATDDVLLQRVTLRGEAAAIDNTRASLKTALEQTIWPATAPGEFLFLRRVTGRGNPREIAARAASDARHLADSAVDGWSAIAPDALAVRFSSHASLLACLLRDLLQGYASQRWYWRHWQRELQLPADEAMVTLLREAPLHLPAVVAQLRTTSVWKPFWQQLGNRGAGALLAITAQVTGWSNAVQTTLATANALENGETATTVTTKIVPLFDLTFLSCGSNDSRPLLAALLTLWQQAPTLLGQESGALQLQHLASAIVAEPANTDEQQRSPESLPHERSEWFGYGTERNPGMAPQNSFEPNSDDQQQIPPSPPFSKGGDKARTLDASPSGRMKPRTSPPLKKGGEGGFNKPRTQIEAKGDATPSAPEATPLHQDSNTAMDGTEQNSRTETSGSADPFEQSFVTPQGGLLYLLNFLNLPSLRAQLPSDQIGAGWRWLHDLATALGCAPEGGLLELIARECDMKNGVELAQQPPITPVEQLLRLGAGRYGDEVWQADTWRIPARLIANASHLDLHFRLNDANLAVRRVGLDINPGWLPWLGRVVTFHYGSGLEPGR